MNLKNKVAIVTGSSSGIGASIAVLLAEKGARVVVNSRKNTLGGEAVVKKILGAGGEAIHVQADVSTDTGAEKLFREAREKFGSVDILVNNAGDAQPGELNDIKVWEYQFNNILLSAVRCTSLFLETDKDTDLRKIVNVSSMYGLLNGGNTSFLAYSSAKAALNSLTVNLAKKLSPNILVNAIAPGWTWTPPWDGTTDKEKDEVAKRTKINRFIEPEEIAMMVASIIENDAITGQVVTVDGGATLKDMF